MRATKPLTTQLQERFPQWVVSTHDFRGDDTVTITRAGLVNICRALRDDAQWDFNMLIDITGVDLSTMGQGLLGEVFRPIPAVDPSITWVDFSEEIDDPHVYNVQGEVSARFEVVYHLYSIQHKHRLRLKVAVSAEDPHVDSVVSVWRGANWFEREVWDFFGVVFRGHPNLKRILMYEGFVGHPLRKDYPVNKRQPLIGPQN